MCGKQRLKGTWTKHWHNIEAQSLIALNRGAFALVYPSAPCFLLTFFVYARSVQLGPQRVFDVTRGSPDVGRACMHRFWVQSWRGASTGAGEDEGGGRNGQLVAVGCKELPLAATKTPLVSTDQVVKQRPFPGITLFRPGNELPCRKESRQRKTSFSTRTRAFTMQGSQKIESSHTSNRVGSDAIVPDSFDPADASNLPLDRENVRQRYLCLVFFASYLGRAFEASTRDLARAWWARAQGWKFCNFSS